MSFPPKEKGHNILKKSDERYLGMEWWSPRITQVK